VLQYVGMVASMEGVAIIHTRDLAGARSDAKCARVPS